MDPLGFAMENFNAIGLWRAREHGKLIKTASRLIREKLGVKPELSTGGGTSDGRFIAPMGVELIELGPVNSTIHKINECVSIEELEHLTVIYQKIVQQMLES